METKVFAIDPDHPDDAIISDCSRTLLEGGLVAFPTETVYGLGANALDQEAVRRIFRVKGRPSDNPLILHVTGMAMVEPYATNIPDLARTLAKAFWPGPVSFILRKSPSVPELVTAGLPSAAFRVPDHPVALALIDACGIPVAAPSANLSGKPSPTNASHVLEDLRGVIDAVLDGGTCRIGLESTVVDLSRDTPRILRPGGISYEELRLVAQDIVKDYEGTEEQIPRSPGMKYTHYAPDSPMIVVQGGCLETAAEINRLSAEYARPGILCSRETVNLYVRGEKLCPGSIHNPVEIASNLFRCLRIFNRLEVDIIFSEYFDIRIYGEAVMNRILKAAGHRLIRL